jgi:DNA-binding PucR family transcriptional regulator
MATQQSIEPDALRSALARFTACPDWLADLSEAITEAIHAELPELDVDVDLRASTYASTESVLRLLAELIASGRPPAEAEPPAAAIDYARELVRHGLPIDTLLRAYHVGQATFFERWAATLRNQIEDPLALARAIEDGAAWTFEYLRTLTPDLIHRYAAERERWVRSAAALRSETIRALVDGEPGDVATASRRLRYELERAHLAFVVWNDVPDESDLGALELQAAKLAGELGSASPLLVPLSGHVVAAWIGSHGGLPAPPATLPDGASAAFGRPGSGVDGFCRSHREALSARRVAQLTRRRPGTVTSFADVALTALASVDERAAREFVADELGPLAADDEDARRLAATLRAYLEERSSPRRTAQRLGVHENTIKNRVRAIEELRGRPADERIAETLVALRLARTIPRD